VMGCLIVMEKLHLWYVKKTIRIFIEITLIIPEYKLLFVSLKVIQYKLC
jgi:hypothetical protein